MNYKYDIKQLEAQIKEAEAKIEELNAKIEAEQEAPPVWKPEDGETYYTPRSCGIGQDPWFDSNPVDKYYLKIGKVFKTEQEAEDYDRALTLIETIRRDRYKAQGKWYPIEDEAGYTVRWGQYGNTIITAHTCWSLPSSVLGVWKHQEVLRDVIKKHEPELMWYFTEYLPSVN